MSEVKFNPHVSVDCVVFGFDGKNLKVLLLERHIKEQNEFYNDKKLPGSIIFETEDLESAAYRILNELTGLKNIYLSQFQSFGDPKRTKNPRDIVWLENTTNLKIGRIVTVGYVALIKINSLLQLKNEYADVVWFDVNKLGKTRLAFDHVQIIQKGLAYIRRKSDLEPELLFELLPRKFTISQLRILHDTIHQKQSDVRNFQKKVKKMPYVVALGEKEKNVPHRAANLYKFDRKKV
ncbi:MAG: NUDIX hydrolase [Porphyromonadaceae bacterium]|nr:NUDIX hydrolase [Porphyromonadaceae bacterium]